MTAIDPAYTLGQLEVARAQLLARLRDGLPLLVYGDGLQTRDFLHVQDLTATIAWLAARLAGQPPSFLALNAGSGVRTTLTELAAHAGAASPRPTAGITHVDVHRAGDITHACADLTLARSLGAPEPAWSTAEAVAQFIRWAWDRPGAASQAWDAALEELTERGLAT